MASALRRAQSRLRLNTDDHEPLEVPDNEVGCPDRTLESKFPDQTSKLTSRSMGNCWLVYPKLSILRMLAWNDRRCEQDVSWNKYKSLRAVSCQLRDMVFISNKKKVAAILWQIGSRERPWLRDISRCRHGLMLLDDSATASCLSGTWGEMDVAVSGADCMFCRAVVQIDARLSRNLSHRLLHVSWVCGLGSMRLLCNVNVLVPNASSHKSQI